jgi:diguanylate cyclase (GGDEF)-like protein
MTTGPVPTPHPPDAGDPAFDALRAIWNQHRPVVLERLQVLEHAVAELETDDLGEDARREAEREAHKLAGSVGTFGFARASERAREMELILGAHEALGSEHVPALAELMMAVRDELEREPAAAAAPVPEPADDERSPLLLVVDDDPNLQDRVAGEAAARSMRVQCATSPAAAREAAACERPDAVLLDLGFADGSDDALELLSELSAQSPSVPVLVFTVSDAFTDRVEVARRGGRGFVHKSLHTSELFAAVAQLLERVHAADTKIVAVDDDPAVLDALRALLEPQGIALTTVSDPGGLWNALREIDPDLLILDVDMPGVNGIDLCRVVRNDPHWGALPIIFLTTRRDAETVQDVFGAGADDYLNKPIVGAELTMRISNRLDRIRLYRALADTDALTGVANRRKATEGLEQLTRTAARYGQPLALAEIDIDRFKEVNDRFGHAAGDAVLRRLGELLRWSFRGDDVVARWGGEEFVIGMYGMSRQDGVQRVAEALEAFRQEDFGPHGVLLALSFSAGVAEYPEDGAGLHALYRAADGALYQAKAAGRDRVLPVGWQPARAAGSVDVVVVEDDPLLAELLVHGLETRGYSTRCLDDGPSAAATLTGAHPELQGRVLLLDVDLPGLDGLSLLRRLAADGVLGETQAIMLTARSSEAEVLRALELGAADHVAKPFSVPVLMQKVRRALVPR